MLWLYLAAYFFGGAALTNGAPHLVSGLTGRRFQSPFAKPPGTGLSSPTVNVVWGFFNLVLGYLLICRVGDFDLRNTAQVGALGLGVFVMMLLAARHFGRFHGGEIQDRP